MCYTLVIKELTSPYSAKAYVMLVWQVYLLPADHCYTKCHRPDNAAKTGIMCTGCFYIYLFFLLDQVGKSISELTRPAVCVNCRHLRDKLYILLHIPFKIPKFTYA